MNNIVFDIGRVLIRYYSNELTAPYVSDPDDLETVAAAVFDRALWDPLDLADITGEELKAAACAKLPARLHASACAAYDHWAENAPIIPDMAQLVADLKRAGKKLYLLSNMSVLFIEQRLTDPHLKPLFSLFDGAVFSSEVHLVKPDPAIYRLLLQKYSLDPADCMFVDDLARNVEAARSVGMRGWQYDGDTPRLRAALLGETHTV